MARASDALTGPSYSGCEGTAFDHLHCEDLTTAITGS